MSWVFIFFVLAFLAPFMLRLPGWCWRILFVVPYLGAFGEALRPFVLQEWPVPREGLMDFFALLVTGIGACVSIYSGSYFKHDERKRFFPLLFAFTGSMLGVLWADNIFLFYGFWEATSFCSFLLIAFKYTEEEVRRGAKQALIVNTIGGLSLLFGLLILNYVTGSTSLTEILGQNRQAYQNSGLLTFLILLAAMTKSAQFPLHFWLPNAMVAPTPASCYLHSATMVKMGVFLLARFYVLFESNVSWAVVLVVVGSITLLWGLLVSLVKTDIKQLFAWTTVSSLGGMCILVGLNVGYSWKAFFSYVLAHSCYKASLFLCVGNIDKQTGSRNVYHMLDLIHRMPMTSVALLMALGSMIGLPFSLGFLGKEYLFKSALELKGPGTLLVAVLVCSSALSFVVAYRLMNVIFKKEQAPKRILREASPLMWMPPLILASLGWVTGIFLEKVNFFFLRPVVSSVSPQEASGATLEMFTGLNIALGLSVISLGLGVLLSFGLLRHLMRIELWMKYDRARKEKGDMVITAAKKITSFFQNGLLSTYLFWILIPLLGLFALNLSWANIAVQDFIFLTEWRWHDVIPFIMIFGGLVLLFFRRALLQIMSIGIVGYGIALVYMKSGATDLAMTQIAVETLSVLIFVTSLKWLKPNLVDFAKSYQWVRGAITAATFVLVFLLSEILRLGKTRSIVSSFFSEHAEPLGFGKNVVNVILVDFRALDTFGEASVLGIVALGVMFLLSSQKMFRPQIRASKFLKIGVSYFAPIFMAMSLYILLRGHNAPGGGFIGGLVLALAMSFYGLINGESKTQRWLILKPWLWISLGLFTCLLAGIAPMFHRAAPFKAYWLTDSVAWVGTPLAFDIGVFWVVLGVGTSLAFSLLRRMS